MVQAKGAFNSSSKFSEVLHAEGCISDAFRTFSARREVWWQHSVGTARSMHITDKHHAPYTHRQPKVAIIFIILMSTCVVQERDAVLVIVASVLHLGNISFTHGDMDNAMLLDERSEDAMYIVAELMQVSSYITIPLASCRSYIVIKSVSLHQ